MYCSRAAVKQLLYLHVRGNGLLYADGFACSMTV